MLPATGLTGTKSLNLADLRLCLVGAGDAVTLRQSLKSFVVRISSQLDPHGMRYLAEVNRLITQFSSSVSTPRTACEQVQFARKFRKKELIDCLVNLIRAVAYSHLSDDELKTGLGCLKRVCSRKMFGTLVTAVRGLHTSQATKERVKAACTIQAAVCKNKVDKKVVKALKAHALDQIKTSADLEEYCREKTEQFYGVHDAAFGDRVAQMHDHLRKTFSVLGQKQLMAVKKVVGDPSERLRLISHIIQDSPDLMSTHHKEIIPEVDTQLDKIGDYRERNRVLRHFFSVLSTKTVATHHRACMRLTNNMYGPDQEKAVERVQTALIDRALKSSVSVQA